MSAKRICAHRPLVSVLIAVSFAFAPLSVFGQQAGSAVPRREQVAAAVREAYDRFRGDTSGNNADHIPYLAQVDPALFGVAVVTTDNQVFTLGDVEYAFSIQAISKVFTLALAMEELGRGKVFQRVGSEPTGQAFNSVLAVVDMPAHTGSPLACAIATTSLIAGKNVDEKWNKILAFYSQVAGEKLSLIEDVYKSEAATNAGNKALAMLLTRYARIYADPFESVDIYARQCAVGVNTEQLARMGATLANNGVNPKTGQQVIKPADVPYVLSAMTMAGPDDSPGGSGWHVGLPVKSGVGGGIVAVVPGKGAIAVFAPRLDAAGNSVKAQRVIEYVVNKLDLNGFLQSSARLRGTAQP